MQTVAKVMKTIPKQQGNCTGKCEKILKFKKIQTPEQDPSAMLETPKAKVA